jgi:hypothetical protein
VVDQKQIIARVLAIPESELSNGCPDSHTYTHTDRGLSVRYRIRNCTIQMTVGNQPWLCIATLTKEDIVGQNKRN